ncbi:HET-domain-containing protein [Amniculicola lignicola CBS 123094]|uniref:HET-domain-containing protein n=1 Tax=Amniculicola lignicola CBS 123094 TaxID=1392246 RepID=A0A6A5X439_9PLEO|nr:HET-domain-containing protein [Amniculicola lignicola CBS 123094]
MKVVDGGILPEDSYRFQIVLDEECPLKVNYQTRSLEFFVEKPIHSPWPCLGQASVVTSGLSYASVATLAKDWLVKCETGHSQCKEKTTTVLPKRVLDVGTEDDKFVRLHHTSAGLDSYIALSYCWGYPNNNLTTTLPTIGERQAGIGWSLIPNTVCDAILLTRLLGFRYLWVDALCIIQDSFQDWEEEAAKMGAIYEGATLTLSATRAVSVDEGFIKPRDLTGHSVHEIPTEAPDGSMVSVFARVQFRHNEIIPSHLPPDPTNNPLVSRGWCFQERLLSRRTLHFLDKELIWECRCNYWCECRSGFHNLVNSASPFSQVLLDPSSHNLISVWQRLISEYSRRSFTKYSDTLPALAGILQKFEDMGAGTYCAGLWRENLVFQLLWVADLSGVDTKGDRNIGPSWSWTSTPFPISWPFEDSNNQIMEVEITHVDTVGSERIRLISSPQVRIRLRGKLVSAYLDLYEEIVYLYRCSSKQGINDAIEQASVEQYAQFHSDVPFTDDQPRSKKVSPEETVFCLLFYSRPQFNIQVSGFDSPPASEDGGTPNGTVWFGLVLRPSGEKSIYERVGIAEGELTSDEPGWFDEVDLEDAILV